MDIVKFIQDHVWKHAPSGVILAVAIIVLVATIVPAVQLVTSTIRGIFRAFRALPVFHPDSRAARRRAERRRHFADYVDSQLRDINNREEWYDYRFAELQAHVETRTRSRSMYRPFDSAWRPQLRKSRSLTRALRHSDEKVILLQGDPGSGKSVALRHVARRLTRRAIRSRSPTSLIPVYLNLKMSRVHGQSVDAALIERFVNQRLREGATSDVDQFLDDELQVGLHAGTWFLLFDSFDEIPEVLSATDLDETVKAYSKALNDYLHSMNACRAIVASRYFHSPTGQPWPTFRILPLSRRRQRKLVTRASLPRQTEGVIRTGLAEAGREIADFSANPLFLALLCDFVRDSGSFPSATYLVFEHYVTRRLTREAGRRKNVSRSRRTTCARSRNASPLGLTISETLGLEPRQADLVAAVVDGDLIEDPELASLVLDALEYIKLGRSEGSHPARTRTFTFAHRRFQEFFATRHVLTSPEVVSPMELLHKTESGVKPPSRCCRRKGRRRVRACSTPLRSCSTTPGGRSGSRRARMINRHGGPPVAWLGRASRGRSGPGSFVSLLQAGFRGHEEQLPEPLRVLADEILVAAFFGGGRLDQKWALDVAGAGSSHVTDLLIAEGFLSGSDWLRDAAYSQLARLGDVLAKLLSQCSVSSRNGKRRKTVSTKGHCPSPPSPARRRDNGWPTSESPSLGASNRSWCLRACPRARRSSRRNRAWKNLRVFAL